MHLQGVKLCDKTNTLLSTHADLFTGLGLCAYRSQRYWTLFLARLMGEYRLARWRLSSSSVVCNTAGVRADRVPGARVVGRPTLQGGPVVLRPVRATPCFINPTFLHRKPIEDFQLWQRVFVVHVMYSVFNKNNRAQLRQRRNESSAVTDKRRLFVIFSTVMVQFVS